jgi:hypothetical protein
MRGSAGPPINLEAPAGDEDADGRRHKAARDGDRSNRNRAGTASGRLTDAAFEVAGSQFVRA